jgi:hypothetical protein
MKKLPLIGFLALCGLLLTGCNRNKHIITDYNCAWNYEIVNETDLDIVYTCGKVEVTVKPGAKEMIFMLSTECEENDIPTDRYLPDDLISNYSTHKLLLDSEPLPNSIWNRSHWSFSNEVYYAIYTLIITNELIENLA